MGADPRYFLREVSQSFKRNLMLNLTSVSTVMVLIFQLGFFILAVVNINNFSDTSLNKLRMTVVLVPQLTQQKAGELKARILKNPEVASVHFISKDQAFDRLSKKMNWEGDLRNLTNNPLPDTLVVEMRKPDKIGELAQEFQKYPGVEEVKYGNQQVIGKLITLANRIYTVGFIVVGMLLLSAVFLIANTIKLTVFSRRKEIAIMDLVGASHWFIRGPFIMEGLIHGLIGATIAVLLLNALYNAGTRWLIEGLRFIPVVPPGDISLKLSAILLGVGILVGVGASYLSVNRYLKI